MTEIAKLLIQQSLKTVDKQLICQVCISEENNDCNNCYLKDALRKEAVSVEQAKC